MRLGVIGAGSFLRGRAPLFLRAGARIAAVAEPDPAMRQRLTEALGAEAAEPAFFDDAAAMLAAEPLDGVVVASPHGLHFEHVSAALEAGAHALVYKPMVTSSDDARRLVALAERTGRVVSIAIEGIYSAEFRHLRGLLEAGELGRVELVSGIVAQNWLANVDGTWRVDPRLGGGGNLIDSGYHLLAALLHLTGQVPVEAFAYVERRERPIDVLVAAALRFDGGALGTVTVSGDAQGMNENVYLHGTRRCLNVGVYGGRLEFVTGWSDRETVALEPAETAEESFVRCVAGQARTLTPPSLGLQLALVIEAILASASENRPVALG